jgi:hypothetical protein
MEYWLAKQSLDDRFGRFILKNGRKDNIGKCTMKLRIKVRLNNKNDERERKEYSENKKRGEKLFDYMLALPVGRHR